MSIMWLTQMSNSKLVNDFSRTVHSRSWLLLVFEASHTSVYCLFIVEDQIKLYDQFPGKSRGFTDFFLQLCLVLAPRRCIWPIIYSDILKLLWFVLFHRLGLMTDIDRILLTGELEETSATLLPSWRSLQSVRISSPSPSSRTCITVDCFDMKLKSVFTCSCQKKVPFWWQSTWNWWTHLHCETG